jgi:hypothetical protein
MRSIAWGNTVAGLFIVSVKNLTDLFFPSCIHGFSDGFSQASQAAKYVVGRQLLPTFHNLNNNNFSLLKIK